MLAPRMKFGPAALKRHVLPALVAFAAAFVLARSDLAERIEDATLDLRTRLRAKLRPTPPNDQLLVIGIDEGSLKKFKQWPWPRAIHGNFMQLVSAVEPTPPTVVGWDILFPEASPDDADFAESITSSHLDVVLAGERARTLHGVAPDSAEAKAARLRPLPHIEGDRSHVLNQPAILLPVGTLAAVTAVGFVDAPPGSDGVRRRLPLMVNIGGQVYPTLSLQTLLRHWHAAPDQVRVRLGDSITIETPSKLWRIPIDATGAFYINYRHGLEGFKNVGYGEAYERLENRYVKEQKQWAVPAMSDRILLIGQVADGLSDFGPSPFSSLTPLVLVHANAIENVLNEDYAWRVPLAPVWLGSLLLGIAGLAIFSQRVLWQAIAFAIGVPLVYGALVMGAWVERSWFFPVVGPVLGFGALQGYMISRRLLSEQRSKEQIKGMFGTYVSPTLVNRLVDSGKPPQLGGHEEEITAYFSDIQGYSTFSEKLPPKQLVELLNDYLTVCTDTVQEEGGTLDKYIGDAVVAMFGAPIPLPDHAYRACVAALLVQRQLGDLRARWNSQAERWPQGVLKMQSRIGLNSGAAIIGNMGSRTRFNYTMTGDNVNLAARMESGAKHWGVYTMCTEATKVACEQHGGDRVVFRPLGRIVVMGRSQPVPVFEVVALKENISQTTRECLDLFEATLAKYYARDWSGAIAGFERSAGLEPNQPGKTPGVKSNPSLIYIEKARGFLTAPPPPDWVGVHVMDEK